MKAFPLQMLSHVFRLGLACFAVMTLLSPGAPVVRAATPAPVVDPTLAARNYTVPETFDYLVTWLGIPVGRLSLRMGALAGKEDHYAISIRAKAAGILAVIYPDEDFFDTIVQGPARLPVRLDYQNREKGEFQRKWVDYDQEHFRQVRSKTGRTPEEFVYDGPVHNEFSSFAILRALPLEAGATFIVPTFADEKRHEVPVTVEEAEIIETVLLGEARALRVRPRLNFSGLYTKTGDPLIWFTDDGRFLPLRIKAPIKIGTLTANLVGYEREGGPRLQAGGRDTVPELVEPGESPAQ